MNSQTILSRTPGLRLAGVLLLASAAALAAQDGENYVTFAAGGAFVDGDAAAFQKRHQIDRKGYAGIEEFYYSKSDGTRTLTIEGKAMAELNDYQFKFTLDQADKGRLTVGYREFRIWSDGSGDYVPYSATVAGARPFIGLGKEVYALDRSEFFLDGLYRPTEKLDLRINYRHLERDGVKDSTSQADLNLAGINRAIVPSFWELDEKRDIVTGEATMKNERSTLVTALRYEQWETDNARKIRRQPTTAADRFVTHREEFDSDLLNARAYATNRYNDRLFFSGAYSYTTIDTALGGSRVYGGTYDAIYDPNFTRRQARDEGFYNLHGDSTVKQHVANVSLLYTPSKDWSVVPSLRLEREKRDTMAEFIETNVGTTSARLPIVEEAETEHQRDWEEWTAAIEARYTGIKGWAIKGYGEWAKGDGELEEDFLLPEFAPPANVRIARDTQYTRWVEKYGLTANWYPSTKANFALIYQFKDRYTDYDNSVDNTDNTGSDRFPAFVKSQSFQTHDWAVRMTLRPGPNVTLVTRYDLQSTDVDSREVGLPVINSAEMKTKIFSQSLTWSPVNQVFVQGTLNYVKDKLDTPANLIAGNTGLIVPDSVNDYWTTNLTVAWAMDEKTDVTVDYTYFHADNYIDNSNLTVPYGLSQKDSLFSVTAVRQLNDNTSVALRYGLAKNNEKSSGGLNNYDAQMVYGRISYRF